MLSLVGSLLGFGTSFLPKILGFFEVKRDQKHELSMQKEIRETNKQLHGQKLELAQSQGEIDYAVENQKQAGKPTGIGWVDGLRGTVRPVVTYIFVIEFCIMQYVLYTTSISEGMDALEAAKLVLNDEWNAGFWAIIGHWFGNRTFNKK